MKMVRVVIDSECGAGRLTKVGRGGGGSYIYHLVYTNLGTKVMV